MQYELGKWHKNTCNCRGNECQPLWHVEAVIAFSWQQQNEAKRGSWPWKTVKVRPMIDSILENCKKVPQEEKHSIDEQIIPTKCRSSSRQYLPKKPQKWGINVWGRCGVNCMVYDFQVYNGAGFGSKMTIQNSLASHIKMCKKNSKFYLDYCIISCNLWYLYPTRTV